MFYFMNFQYNIDIFIWIYNERMKCEGLRIYKSSHYGDEMKLSCLFLYRCQYNLAMIQNAK